MHNQQLLQLCSDRQVTIIRRHIFLNRLFKFHALIHARKIGGNHSTSFDKRFTAIVTPDAECSEHSSRI